MIEYFPPAELLASERFGSAAPGARTVAPSRVGSGPRILFLTFERAWVTPILQALAADVPGVIVAPLPQLPAEASAHGEASPQPDLILLPLAGDSARARRLLDQGNPERPPVIILHAPEDQRQAEDLLAAGAQDCCASDQFTVHPWGACIRRSIRRQEALRNRLRSRSHAPVDGISIAEIPGLLWCEEPGSPLQRIPTEAPAFCDEAFSHALDQAVDHWLKRTAPRTPTPVPQLLTVADGTRNRSFFAVAKTLDEPSPQRRLVAGLEITSLEDPLETCNAVLGSLGHDLKTPLSAILMSARVSEDAESGSDQREMWQIVRESAESMLTMVQDRLAVGSAKSGSKILW